MMAYRRTPTTRRRGGEHGFTLIELLVVIVILGILSAVVVFAVRGVNNKGGAAAVATDERIIRTAQEAYCANEGKYATMDQLVPKYLSAKSEIHNVEVTGDPNAPGRQGNCGTDPAAKHYRITCADDSEMPNCGVPETPDVPDVPPGVPCVPGTWCTAPGTLFGGGPMLQLTDGRVLLLEKSTSSGNNASFYDPRAPERGKWTSTTAPPDAPSRNVGVQLTGPVCEQSCGKVLVGLFFPPTSGTVWQLFDPSKTPPTWESAGLSSYESGLDKNAVQLSNGMVLVVHGGAGAELYDPGAKTFSKIIDGGAFSSGVPGMVPLEDGTGRVLVTGKSSPDQAPVAKLYDPGTNRFTNTAPAGATYYNNAVLLSPGRVLGVWGSTAEIYDVVSNKWEPALSCDLVVVDAGCYVMSRLPSGKVLAYSGKPDGTGDGQTWLFDPSRPMDLWTRTGDLNSSESTGFGLLLTGENTCVNCNHVLSVGRRTEKAELYRPTQ